MFYLGSTHLFDHSEEVSLHNEVPPFGHSSLLQCQYACNAKDLPTSVFALPHFQKVIPMLVKPSNGCPVKYLHLLSPPFLSNPFSLSLFF